MSASKYATAMCFFLPPWTGEDIGAAFVVRDQNGQGLAYIYYEDEPGRRTASKMLSKDETQRIAANLAKLQLTLVGCMTPENRWRNIILVAARVWVTDLFPAAIGTFSLSFSGWMGSIVWYAILAALSGVISLLITAFIEPAAKPI